MACRKGESAIYGDASRQVEIADLEERGSLVWLMVCEIPVGSSAIEVIFAYTMKNKPLE